MVYLEYTPVEQKRHKKLENNQLRLLRPCSKTAQFFLAAPDEWGGVSFIQKELSKMEG